LKTHPDVDLSFHPSYKDVNGNRTEVMAKHSNENKIFSVEDSIIGHGAETASMMFTNSLISSLHSWFKTAMPGDYVSEVMGSVRGGSLYIDRIMSVYRSGLDEGWTEGELKKSTQERRQFLNNIDEQLIFLDEYLGGKYHKEFDKYSTMIFTTLLLRSITTCE
jgi:hypothetical protein